MSATNRGAERVICDFYPTPPAHVRRILARLGLPGGRWLEPSAGDGAIIRAAARPDVAWTACEIRPEAKPALEATGARVVIGDFLAADLGAERFAAAVLNPPFTLALPFAMRCLELADNVLMLARLNWLESQDREPWLRRHTPDVFVIPDRPSFVGGGTDATAYAWMFWERGAHNRSSGRVEVLPVNVGQLELLP